MLRGKCTPTRNVPDCGANVNTHHSHLYITVISLPLLPYGRLPFSGSSNSSDGKVDEIYLTCQVESVSTSSLISTSTKRFWVLPSPPLDDAIVFLFLMSSGPFIRCIPGRILGSEVCRAHTQVSPSSLVSPV